MKLLSYALNLIFPAICHSCKGTVSADSVTSCFCKECWNGIEWFNCLCCPKCGLPYAALYTSSDTGIRTCSGPTAAGHLCGNCRSAPPSFDKAVSAGRYSGAMAEAVKLFKYNKKIQLGKRLTEQALKSFLFARTLQVFQNHEAPDTIWGCPAVRADTALSSRKVIVPVPLHVKRLREREFNQSAVIGSVIGKNLGIPVAASALIRLRNTRPQVELDGRDRRENVVGAFSVKDRGIVEGREIILVDDVYTSGSTISECARVLKNNGAERIYAVTLARMVG